MLILVYVTYLLKGRRALHTATTMGRNDVVQTLISADVREVSIFHINVY